MNKEFEFLKIINNKLSNPSFLGDDCAYLKEYNLAISSDSLIQDVHFKTEYMTIYEIAKKALLVNISDILASGAKIKYALINLSGKLNEKIVEEFYSAVSDIEKEFNINIIGGDLTSSDKLTISVTVLGDTKNRNISSRSNAKIGYIVAVVGEFGSSARGLIELQNGIKDSYFINYHKEPKLYQDLSSKISLTTKKPYAMMDSSDSLSDSLIQIASKSGVRIDVDYSLIPKKIEDRNIVLNGGEDYSLVLAIDSEDYKKINDERLIKIGEVKQGNNVYIDNEKIEFKGFNHFE